MKFIPPKLINPAWLPLLLLGAGLALTGTSMAQNQYYVNSAAGSDSNDGSQARPWKTIQHANSALTLGQSGAVVHVAPGTYSGPITTNKSGTASARIVFISDTKWGAKLVLSSPWQVSGSYVDIDGFDMTGSTYAFNINALDNTTGPAVGFVRIQYNYMHDFNIGGCGSYGVISETPRGGMDFPNMSHDITYNGNVIRHAGSYGSGVYNCVTLHGIYQSGPRDIITNNIISGITGWGIKIDSYPGAGYIVNNTIFNNGGGINLTDTNDAGQTHIIDYWTLSNNIVVNNGVDAPQGGRFGINFYHVTGTHNVVSNNLIYGNKPTDYAHHDVACVAGTPISGSDADGTPGGCPSSSSKSDAGTTVTFTNFQSDTNTAPASNYDVNNYQIKAGSNAIQNGTTACASSPGLSPCVPTIDIVGVVRRSTLDIGAFEQGAVAGIPSAPTGLTAAVQ